MTNAVEIEIKNKIKHHMITGLDLSVFLAEIGWEDWMNEFTEAPEGEAISERESAEIDEYLKKLWNEVEMDLEF